MESWWNRAMNRVGVLFAVLLFAALLVSCPSEVTIDLAGTWTVVESSAQCALVEGVDLLTLNSTGAEITSITITEDRDVTPDCTLVVDLIPTEFVLSTPLRRTHTSIATLQEDFDAAFGSVGYTVASFAADSLVLTRSGLASNNEDPQDDFTETWTRSE